MITETRASAGAWRMAVLARRGGAEDVRERDVCDPGYQLLVGGIRGMRSFAGGGSSPSHPIRGKFWSGSRAFRQPNDIRERGTTECGRAE